MLAQSHKDRMAIASLELRVTSLVSALSDASIRARQAEEMCGLMQSNWDMQQVVELIVRHMDQRATERAVQQQSLIQTTIVALNQALAGSDSELKEIVNTVVKELTMATSTLHELLTKEQELQRRSHNGTTAGN
jgi:hypothetical protein